MARVFFVLLTTWLATLLADSTEKDPILFSMIGFFGSIVLVIFEFATNAIASRKILMAAFGCLMGFIFARFAAATIPENIVDRETSLFVSNMFFGYFGIVLALRHADWLRPGNLKFFLMSPKEHPKVLDSSVIIDGRINRLIELGLIGGPIAVPSFVLREIQNIADSDDPFRRARGRRGLEMLDDLRRHCESLDVIDNDFPEQNAVDQKLILLSREMSADLVTNDYNLHKIAEIHQINVINVNELADALKPAVYVGEEMHLALVKPGKEQGQAVGYLDDGTMVVVDDAEGAIGQDREVIVSNILQNPSGRLVFARLRNEA